MNKYKSISLLLIAIAMTAGSSFAQDNTVPTDATIMLTEAPAPGQIDQYGNPLYTISGQDEITLQPGQHLTIYVTNPDSYFKFGYFTPIPWSDTAPVICCEFPWLEGTAVLDRNQSLDENGDPLSFHFVASANTGTEVLTCVIWNTGTVGAGIQLVDVASFPITVHVQAQ